MVIISLFVYQLAKMSLNVTRLIIETIQKEIDQQMLNTEEAITKRMLEITQEYEMGNMTEEDYADISKMLMNRFDMIKGSG